MGRATTAERVVRVVLRATDQPFAPMTAGPSIAVTTAPKAHPVGAVPADQVVDQMTK
jgi:hypothetical protein